MSANKIIYLFLGLGLFACGSSKLGSCPPNSTAQQAAGQTIVNQKCVTCHSSKLSGPQRLNAPVGDDWDNLDKVRSEAAELYEEVEAGKMPPGSKLPADEIEKIRIWLACGAN